MSELWVPLCGLADGAMAMDIDAFFASMDTDGNECVTQAEFNLTAGQNAPAFEDVARLDRDATCISKEDLNQFMNSQQGPPTGRSNSAGAGSGGETDTLAVVHKKSESSPKSWKLSRKSSSPVAKPVRKVSAKKRMSRDVRDSLLMDDSVKPPFMGSSEKAHTRHNLIMRAHTPPIWTPPWASGDALKELLQHIHLPPANVHLGSVAPFEPNVLGKMNVQN